MLIAMHARVGAAPSSVLSPVSPRQAYCRRIKRCTVVAKADDTPDVSSQPTDLDAQLLEDLQRLKAKEASQRAQQPAYPEVLLPVANSHNSPTRHCTQASTAQTGGSLAGAKELIDKVCVNAGIIMAQLMAIHSRF